MAAVQTDQVAVTINGQSVTVPKGTLILDAGVHNQRPSLLRMERHRDRLHSPLRD